MKKDVIRGGILKPTRPVDRWMDPIKLIDPASIHVPLKEGSEEERLDSGTPAFNNKNWKAG